MIALASTLREEGDYALGLATISSGPGQALPTPPPTTVERAFRLPWRYWYGHTSKNAGKDADVAT